MHDSRRHRPCPSTPTTGGIVSGDKGPEAGVWVIAETTDLPTKFARIVVTDDRGPLPDPRSPEGRLQRVGARLRPGGLAKGEGLAGPGAEPEGRARAEPARGGRLLPGRLLVLARCKVPEKSEFPGTGPTGNGISPTMRTQAHWLRSLKSGGCTACHQLGNKATREIPAALGKFPDMAARLGATRAVGPGRRQHGQRARPARPRARAAGVRRLDRSGRRAASCRRRRRGRRGWSATWSSRCGTGQTRRRTCTTRCRRIGATPP